MRRRLVGRSGTQPVQILRTRADSFNSAQFCRHRRKLAEIKPNWANVNKIWADPDRSRTSVAAVGHAWADCSQTRPTLVRVRHACVDLTWLGLQPNRTELGELLSPAKMWPELPTSVYCCQSRAGPDESRAEFGPFQQAPANVGSIFVRLRPDLAESGANNLGRISPTSSRLRSNRGETRADVGRIRFGVGRT